MAAMQDSLTNDSPTDLIAQVRAAVAARTPLRVVGGDTKAFFGEAVAGQVLATQGFSGIVAHEPSELVMTVRAGTPLAEVEAALAESGQCLPFDPPRFWAGSTIGGVVAAGLAGPARATAGGVRDYVLGAQFINGLGEWLTFGGQVMKNVAGYDVSRALAGSMGTLGVITHLSLKVLPVAPAEATLVFRLGQREALEQLHRWGGQPLPLNASCWVKDDTAPDAPELLFVRLRGAVAAVESACERLNREAGGQRMDNAQAGPDWAACRDQSLPFFQRAFARRWPVEAVAAADPRRCSACRLPSWSNGRAHSAGCGRRLRPRLRSALRPPPFWGTPRCSGPEPTARPACAVSTPKAPPCRPSPAACVRPSTRRASSTRTRWVEPTMQTNLAPEFQNTLDGQAAEAICASVCIAGSVPPPVRPTSCWATSWTVRVAAST